MTATATLIGDYAQELAGIDDELSALTERGPEIWQDAESATRLAFRVYHRASLTGRFDDLHNADVLLHEAISRLGPAEDLCLLTAYVDLKTHRVHQVEQHLAAAPTLADRPESWALLADADLQRGRYPAARRGYESALDAEPSWDNMARIAHLLSTFGDFDRADDWFASAEEELTAKEMRSFSWIEIQRGLLDLQRGRYREAREHYECATAAFSGWWLVAEHIAALTAAEGDLEVAFGLYRKVAEANNRPELNQACGDLLARLGRADEARDSYDEALTVYLESAQRGEVHYLHHLAELYTEGLDDPDQGVAWAKRDAALRPCWSTQAALAWALYRSRHIHEATARMRDALATGAVDAHFFSRAAEVYATAGLSDEADDLERRAAEINPRHHRGHMHP